MKEEEKEEEEKGDVRDWTGDDWDGEDGGGGDGGGELDHVVRLDDEGVRREVRLWMKVVEDRVRFVVVE